MPTSFIDAQPYFLAQGLLFIALPLTVWTILAGRHDATTVALWCVGGLMAGGGFVLYGLRGFVPDWLGYQVATALAYGAYLVRGGALQRELQRRPRWIAYAVIVVLAVLGYQLAMTWSRDARELYSAVFRLVGSAWLAWLAFTLARRESTRSATMLGAVYLLLSLASLVRAAGVLQTWGEGHVPTALDYALINIAGLLAALYSNLGYVGLVLERSRARERAQAAALERDNTQRLQAEQHTLQLDALRAERREVLNEAIPAMLHSIDARGRLLAVSDTWLSKLGYTRAEVIGKASADFLTEASREYARQVVLPEFFRAGRCDNIAYQMVRKDGGVIDVLLSAVLERDAGGHPLRSQAVIEDVTEKLAREAELAREHTLRLQVERHALELNALVAERSEMLHVLAHEVRQPLNNASAALQSAAAALSGTTEQAAAQRLQRAQAVLGEVLAGLDNTLAAAALLAGGATPVERAADTDINALIAITLADIDPAERPRVEVARSTATRTATMDMGLMRLALRNLLANALSYSPAGSPVVLRVADSDEPLALVLEVIDAGEGIEAD